MTTSNTGLSNTIALDDLGNIDWSKLTLTSTYNSSSISPIITSADQQLSVKGNSHFDGDAVISGKLEVGGVDIGDSLSRIEKRLAILRPNSRLEAEWEELRALGERYRELEAELLSGEELLRILREP